MCRNNKDEVRNDDQCIKLNAKIVLFSHFSPKIDQIENRRPSGPVLLKSTCPYGRRFASRLDDIPILKGEISVG